MIESISGLLNTVLAVALGIIGWIIKRMIERLDLGEKRMTKIEVEVALKEVHNKLDRMMEVLVKR